jgi:pyruvate,water dikinase
VSLAVRSSATAADLPEASSAGAAETFLNITGDSTLLDACRRCFASLFTDRSIHYRIDQGYDHFKVALSVGIMKMVRSDLASSGVMFTLDTESGFRDVVFITGSYGLGEKIVQGAVDPDEFYVHKPTYASGHRAVLRRLLGDKAMKLVFAEGGIGHTTRNIPTPKADRGTVLPHRRRDIAREVETRIGRALLSGDVRPGAVVGVGYSDGELTVTYQNQA